MDNLERFNFEILIVSISRSGKDLERKSFQINLGSGNPCGMSLSGSNYIDGECVSTQYCEYLEENLHHLLNHVLYCTAEWDNRCTMASHGVQ